MADARARSIAAPQSCAAPRETPDGRIQANPQARELRRFLRDPAVPFILITTADVGAFVLVRDARALDEDAEQLPALALAEVANLKASATSPEAFRAGLLALLLTAQAALELRSLTRSRADG